LGDVAWCSSMMRRHSGSLVVALSGSRCVRQWRQMEAPDVLSQHMRARCVAWLWWSVVYEMLLLQCDASIDCYARLMTRALKSVYTSVWGERD